MAHIHSRIPHNNDPKEISVLDAQEPLELFCIYFAFLQASIVSMLAQVGAVRMLLLSAL